NVPKGEVQTVSLDDVTTRMAALCVPNKHAASPFRARTPREKWIKSMSKTTTTRRTRTVALTAAAALIVTLAGCATDTNLSGGGGAEGTTLAYGLSAEPTDIKTGVDQGSAA